MKSYIWVEEVCTFMNDLLDKDPDMIQALIDYRVGCNQQVVDHPTVQVRDNQTVGLLGILNGLFDTLDNESGQICMGVSEEGKICGFYPTGALRELGTHRPSETVRNLPKKETVPMKIRSWDHVGKDDTHCIHCFHESCCLCDGNLPGVPDED